MKRIIRLPKVIAGCIAALAMWTAVPAHATYVLLDFDGDAAFPSITWQENTTGLAAFTGSAFGLSAIQKDAVIASIVTLLYEDYAPYDVEFVTDTSGLASWYTWGIDDSAYVFSEGQPTPPIGPNAPFYDEINPYAPCPTVDGHFYDCHRLYGKAGTEPGDDQYGASIYNPTFARTFAGSFALGAGSADPSSPALNIATHTTGQIAQALGNSAAHEIAHLFGVGHSNFGSGTDLQYVEIESIEANNNKSFSATHQAVLLSFLGARPNVPVPVPEPSPLELLGIGLLAVFLATRRRAQRAYRVL